MNTLGVLSDRELEVLTLVTEGLHNREIAEKLIVAPSTVDTHVHHILTKLGVSTRTEAAIHALKSGLEGEHESTD